MLKLFPLKIPTDSDIGLRFKTAAEKAGLTYWELLGRMLKWWESQPDSQLTLFPDHTKRITMLETELETLKNMVANLVTTNTQTVPAKEPAPEANKIPDRIPCTVEDFKAAWESLEGGNIYVDIFALRRRLAWSRDEFDAMLRKLRDDGMIQLHAGDAGTLTPDEIADGFTDENGFRMGSVTWEEGEQMPEKPADEPEPVPEPEPEVESKPEPTAPVEPPAKRRGRKPKQESSPAPAPMPEAPPVPSPRKRGRPPKARS
jgi:hypothetical protein